VPPTPVEESEPVTVSVVPVETLNVDAPPPLPLPAPPLPERAAIPAPPAALHPAVDVAEQVTADAGGAKPMKPSAAAMMEIADDAARTNESQIDRLRPTPPRDAAASSDATCSCPRTGLQTSR